MKKLLFVLIVFTLLSCSKDDEDGFIEVKYTVETTVDNPYIMYLSDDGNPKNFTLESGNTWEYVGHFKKGETVYFYASTEDNPDPEQYNTILMYIYVNGKIVNSISCGGPDETDCSLDAIIP